MTFTITDEQARSMATLRDAGFAITHFYGDGIVRMRLTGQHCVAVFIRPDGSVKRQHVPTFDVEARWSSNAPLLHRHH